MPVKIQSPDVARRIAEFFGIRGKYLPEVEEFVIPTLQIGDLSVAGVPPVGRHASVAFDVAAHATQKWTFRLYAEGLLCVITDFRLIPVAGGGAHVRASFAGGPAPAPLTPGFIDHRITDGQLFPAQVPGAIVGASTQASNINPIIWRSALADLVDNHYQPKGWVIGSDKQGGNGALMLQIGSNNVRCHGSVEWDEYQID